MSAGEIVAIVAIVVIAVVAVVVVVGGARLLWAPRRRARAAGRPPVAPTRGARAPDAPPAPAAPEAAVAEAAPEPAPSAPVAPARVRLRDRLGRTRATIAGALGGFRAGGRVDDETWDQLEEALILADVGIPTVTRVLGSVRARFEPSGHPIRSVCSTS